MLNSFANLQVGYMFIDIVLGDASFHNSFDKIISVACRYIMSVRQQ